VKGGCQIVFISTFDDVIMRSFQDLPHHLLKECQQGRRHETSSFDLGGVGAAEGVEQQRMIYRLEEEEGELGGVFFVVVAGRLLVNNKGIIFRCQQHIKTNEERIQFGGSVIRDIIEVDYSVSRNGMLARLCGHSFFCRNDQFGAIYV